MRKITCLLLFLCLLPSFALADKTITLTFTGDITLGGEDYLRTAEDSFFAVYDREGAGYFLKNFADFFAEDDLTVVNLEGQLPVLLQSDFAADFHRAASSHSVGAGPGGAEGNVLHGIACGQGRFFQHPHLEATAQRSLNGGTAADEAVVQQVALIQQQVTPIGNGPGWLRGKRSRGQKSEKPYAAEAKALTNEGADKSEHKHLTQHLPGLAEFRQLRPRTTFWPLQLSAEPLAADT